MILWLLGDWVDTSSLFNVFRYLTTRTGAAIMTALLISFVLGSLSHRLAEDAPEKRPAHTR